MRLNYISNYYVGSLRNIQLQYGGQMLPAANVLGVAIILSTMLLKQHSCIDVVLGILLALVLDSLFTTAAERSQTPQVWHA